MPIVPAHSFFLFRAMSIRIVPSLSSSLTLPLIRSDEAPVVAVRARRAISSALRPAKGSFAFGLLDGLAF
jgi:hypothetical protein